MLSFTTSVHARPSGLSSAVVELQNEAIDIACRLGTLAHFLEAARQLLTCGLMSNFEFLRHSRKIIALIELARKTLTAAGAPVYSFSYCPPSLVRYKAAYIDLLKMLRENRYNVDPSLQARMHSLLISLSSTFTIQRGEGSDNTPTIECERSGAQYSESISSSRPSPSFKNSPPTQLMAPPDAFPPPEIPQSVRLPRMRRQNNRLWDPDTIREVTRKRRTAIPAKEIDQENVAPTERLIRPMPRRFGIFCTGKKTMHGDTERVGRPGTIRSLIKE
ncbi:hypothetical protein BDQ12DRAFT_736879 [Crucibulum laeve]|uniref:Uncharacterized protein n=1 Tax=Crucibulum laeve TaxID=68775 RepID=A0A5C3LVE3_9AGAR|nr:hypothetical protein BDQ12DRAFT_736879 [Crucibulum laeve]